MYVPVLTLSKENDTKILEELKSEFKRTIKLNKYRSQMTVQPQNNNLNYLIDLTFTNVDRLFVSPFQRIPGENNTTRNRRDSFSFYYVPNIRINDFNVLIDRKRFLDLPAKNEEEACEKIIDMSNNSDYTTGNLLVFIGIYWYLFISNIKNTVPRTYLINDLNGEEITRSFNEKEL